MKLETKFDLNQRVWAISNSNNYYYQEHECPLCGRTGKVTIKSAEYVCPRCQGASVKPVWTIEISVGVVVRIETIRTVEKLARPEGWDNRDSYRLDHVGDGTVWPEDRLFLSEQEAQAECDKRNSILCGVHPSTHANHESYSDNHVG